MKTQEIADFVSGKLFGAGDIEIIGIAEVLKASNGQIAFVEKAGTFTATKASCLIVHDDFDTYLSNQETPSEIITRGCYISVRQPKLAFALIAEKLHPPKKPTPGIHPSAVISESARIGSDVFIAAHVSVGDNSVIGVGTQLRAGAKVGDRVKIGSDCVIHPNVFIEDCCTIGHKVILHSGVVIGADGFGYVRDKQKHVKFPQIGTVVIEDDVEIGANSCVDRGALGETRIGAGTKIDNLVQVGHNVNIGKHVIIAAQTGISGSVVIEDDCTIGGQVGFGDHVRVLSGAVIGSQAGVLPGKIVRPGVWWGTPIQPLDEYKRQNAHVKSIERLKAEVKLLKKIFEDKPLP